ncbi:MAG TPA: TonB-dependent receptor, partial [Flavobacteriales bacterium]|nr:TonB-dependent receptor [Flavobacteriales bacterium]
MKFYFYIILLLFINIIQGQVDKRLQENLDTLQITTYGKSYTIKHLPKTVYVITQTELQKANVESLDDALNLVAGIDVRSRGSKGVQSDLSIRGGNFDQVLILLNGVKVNNPQTGHHSLDLPVDISMIERIEILEGASGQSFGINAYSGAINIITKSPLKEQAKAGLKMGQYGYLKTDFDLAHSMGKLAVYNGFSFQRSNGYLTKDSINNTDFYSIKDFVNIHYDDERYPVDLQAGYHQKDFGANSFYTAKYPWQYEKTQGYFASLSSTMGRKVIVKPQLNYKLHYDEFQLFRESVYENQNGYFVHQNDTAQYAPGVYYPGHNNHKTQQFGGQVQINFKTKYGETFINTGVRNEKIWSNTLGKTLDTPIKVSDRIIYTKSDERTYIEAQINQLKKWTNFDLGLGVNLLYNEQYKTRLTGGGYFSYHPKHFTHYVNINTASRLPTFTDLYYQGPSNIGNPDLKPEYATTYEFGSKYFDQQNMLSVSLFMRDANHTIDWIKYNPQDKWQPQNLTRLKTYGFETNLQRRFIKMFLRKISLSY